MLIWIIPNSWLIYVVVWFRVGIRVLHKGKSKADILLFKETALTAKIYLAILTNLGYRVDSYSSEDAFLDQIDSKNYRFILFDMKPFQRINTESFVVEMIKNSGAKPIAFAEDGRGKYCDVLSPMDSIEAIHKKLAT